MSLASLGFRAAAAPLGQRWLNKLALAPAPMLLAGLSSGMRGVAPSLQQNRLASRKAKGPGGNSRKPARKEDDDDEIEELDLDAADALPVHARRTRISMEAHLRAAAVAAQPVDVSETGDPLENIQQIISQWGRKKEPAQLWTQYQRLVREGDVASLGLAEFNSLFSIFSEGENVAAEVWEARVVEFAGLLEQAGSAGIEYDSESYASIIRFYGLAKKVEQAEKFMKEAGEAGLANELDVALASVEAYALAREFGKARAIFDNVRAANADIAPLRAFYGVLIENHAAADDIQGALRLFQEMQKEPNYRHPARNFTTDPLLEYYARRGELKPFLELFDKLTPVYLNRPDQRAWRSRIEAEVKGGKPADAVRTFYRHIRNKTVLKRDALLAVIPGFVASGQLNVLLRLMMALESWVAYKREDVADVLAKAIPNASVFMEGISRLTDSSKGPFYVIKSVEIKSYEPLAPEVRGMFFKMYADALVRAGDMDKVEALLDEALKPDYKFLPMARPGSRKPKWHALCLRPVYNMLIKRNAELAKAGQKPAEEGATAAEAGLPKASLLHQDMLARRIDPTEETVSGLMLAFLNAEDGPGAMKTLDEALALGFRMPAQQLARLAEAKGLTDAQMDVVKITLKESQAAAAAEAAVPEQPEEKTPVALFA